MRGTLDSDPDSINRCKQLTEMLFQKATADEMWDDFGIVASLIVRILCLNSGDTDQPCLFLAIYE